MANNILFLNPVPLIYRGIMPGFEDNGWNVYLLSGEDHVLGQSAEIQVAMINKYVEKYNIDVVFLDFGVGADFKAIYEYCDSKGVCFCLWGIEDTASPNSRCWIDQTINYCHYYFTTTYETLEYAKSKHNKDIGLLMFGVNPEYHAPIEPDFIKYTCDIALVGNNYSSRYLDFKEFIMPLIKNNYYINIWGNDWWLDSNREVNLCSCPNIYQGYISNDETRSLYNTCKVAIGLNCNRESFSRHSSQQSMRFAEVMGIGNAIFVSPWSVAQENYLGKSGEYIFLPKTSKEMIDNIDFILNISDKDRLIMANKAREFVYKNHSYTDRAKIVINKIINGGSL